MRHLILAMKQRRSADVEDKSQMHWMGSPGRVMETALRRRVGTRKPAAGAVKT